MSAPSPDRLDQLRAPAHWQAVEFISDLHLQPGEPQTFEVWRALLQRPAHERADALFILGDLFEVWVGDDVLDSSASTDQTFWRACADALKAFSFHTPVYFMAGNRDFLLGAEGLTACGMQGLNDPTTLDFLGQHWLLSHGDALCLADTDYMLFREQVRQPIWQREFLARPLAERTAIARGLREQSEARKRSTAGDPSLWADVDTAAARTALQTANAHTLIHGHTHRPAEHALGDGLQRVVLSDWDAGAQPPRAEVLRLDARGLRRIRLPIT
ncbi:UDP-2,3-diacylglucosamine diphosphatase [Hydrogenophaga sp.]|uniref:UDP-2,3-diacylglucosamine diphosphatase n=1 Tax=Hydrogenophaga sp. TaxID=1904254 RepID=UPI002730864A|nr:UDP-2,3-diacylglucosamine diphosphatase [Hydrogenophaga sp.]MDP2015515.1 UDP-2,3-diacylglucosamine diphosphatase [Hydrogenophaga sp.]MDP3164230.1 UDP-2,3-diacylglucosamine diphosphatase [Hydrogenophaga sp.]MDP3810493.1 UDP-2,3-diacylglucosamine diphosphatase [Hydrogenophaga sp.]